jgi:uncharacterized membrane protein
MTGTLGPEGIVGKDMFEILVNGIFAFIMTLIVRNNILLPSDMPVNKLAFFHAYTSNIINDGISFLFLFMILAVFYILTFEILRPALIIDHVTLGLTLSFLFLLVFLPLTSLLYALSASPLPYGVIFHVNILIAGVILGLLGRHISGMTKDLPPGLDEGSIRNLRVRLLLLPAAATAGLLLDGWEVSFSKIPAMVLYLVPILLFVWLSREIRTEDE